MPAAGQAAAAIRRIMAPPEPNARQTPMTFA
jgi:hypothetical protein